MTEAELVVQSYVWYPVRRARYGFLDACQTQTRGCTEAGVRKASREETAGEFVPTLVSVYGEFAADTTSSARSLRFSVTLKKKRSALALALTVGYRRSDRRQPQLVPMDILGGGLVGRPAKEIDKAFDVADIVVLRSSYPRPAAGLTG